MRFSLSVAGLRATTRCSKTLAIPDQLRVLANDSCSTRSRRARSQRYTGDRHPRHLPWSELTTGESRQREGVAVGVREPRNLVTGRSGPDASFVLAHSVVLGKDDA